MWANVGTGGHAREAGSCPEFKAVAQVLSASVSHSAALLHCVVPASTLNILLEMPELPVPHTRS